MTRMLALLAAVLFLIPTLMLAQDGAATFKGKCAMCHGPDGAGKTAMGQKLNIRDLHSAEVQKQGDAELAQVITKGKNKMPAYEGKLTKEQIDQLVGYIRELGKK
jgi:cytochrome c6